MRRPRILASVTELASCLDIKERILQELIDRENVERFEVEGELYIDENECDKIEAAYAEWQNEAEEGLEIESV